MKNNKNIQRKVLILLFVLVSNGYALQKSVPWTGWISLFLFLAVNILPGFCDKRIGLLRVRFLIHGSECLRIFLSSAVLSALVHFVLIFTIPGGIRALLFSALYCYVCHFILFWNGIISVYLTSFALGVRHRVIGALCGPIPILHLIALSSILKIVAKEIEEEKEKEYMNYSRAKTRICATRYPLLMVHGVFFRDFKHFNYWGRVPAELKRNGAVIYYGNHQSALSISDSAEELSARIREIVERSGCEKVNVIAHSKGGLDTRFAMHNLGADKYVASLTTINTPHRGCKFAEHLLSKIDEGVKSSVAATYNAAAKRMGDTSPDFMAAVTDLTAAACEEIFTEMPAPEGVYCQSFGSVLRGARGGRFPLNFSYHFVKEHDGENDGLVSVDSFSFGESCTILEPKGKRGISHGDMIDLNRESIEGFDVREFYVQLVSFLREKGL